MEKSDFDVALEKNDLAFEKAMRQFREIDALHAEVIPKLKAKVAREEASRRNKYIAAVVLAVCLWAASRLPWGVESHMHKDEK